MNLRILGVALLSLAFAAVCLGEESEDVGVEFVPTQVPLGENKGPVDGGEEFGPTQVPWGENKGPKPSDPPNNHKNPFEKGGPECVMIPDSCSEVNQLEKRVKESIATKYCNQIHLGCMQMVRNAELSKIVFPEDCLNGVKNVFHMNKMNST